MSVLDDLHDRQDLPAVRMGWNLALDAVREALRSDETVRLITDSWYVQQVFDWYLNGGEHRRSVDDRCETCSTPEGPVYHDRWPETSELDVVRAVLAALAGDDQ